MFKFIEDYSKNKFTVFLLVYSKVFGRRYFYKKRNLYKK